MIRAHAILVAIASAGLAISAPAAADDHVSTGDYPLDDILAAFATACSGVEDPAVNRASVEAAGWELYEPDADSIMGRLITFGRAAIENEELEDGETPTEILDNGVFRRTISGRSLHIVLSGARIDEIRTTGCRLYDFEATAEPDAETLSSWARRAPEAVSRPSDGLVAYKWNGGLKPGHLDMEIFFAAPDAELPMNIPISGLTLSASNLEIEGL
ncbi:hypothetical protein [Parasphingopyxis sp.]|uniref:hypothetical protein n=1 Tax=Parasphingopyxis sp. TaxID=1920299 RepID=UPI002609C090|nr:hypothetical protein [Parasphingopyxis sp.]